MQILNMRDSIPKKCQFLKFLTRHKPIDSFNEVRTKIKAHQIEQVPKPNHSRDLILRQIEGC